MNISIGFSCLLNYLTFQKQLKKLIHSFFMDRTRTVVTIKKRLQALGCPFYNEENILGSVISFIFTYS